MSQADSGKDRLHSGVEVGLPEDTRLLAGYARSDRSGEVRDLVRVCQAGANAVVLVHRPDLRFVRKTAHRRREEKPIVVLLKT